VFAGHVQIWKHQLESAIAPCTFLAAFGLPGEGVGSWLAATRYAPVQSDYWLSGHEGLRQGPWMSWYQIDMSWIPRPPLLLRVLGSLNFATLLIPPYGFGATGLECIAGDGAACDRAVMHPSIPMPGNTEFPADLTVSTWMEAPDKTTLGTVRPPVPSLVSAIITDHDRTQFRLFWKSDRPVDQAFQEALANHWAPDCALGRSGMEGVVLASIADRSSGGVTATHRDAWPSRGVAWRC
jgi:hypothetical protein